VVVDGEHTVSTVELAADDVAARGLLIADEDPPYPVRFSLKRGPTWPEVQLLVTVLGQPVALIGTTEPRLQAVFRELLEGLG
jgi:hypothetical protein